ncbi:uncharacterized protein [Misgurnus anguillicaudatus]|uniref:uncharacterized protein isoform X2 n=1 Tax=Misgurnus anguillicaudatus TaxID=75329 RepID=UPI003CCFA3DA
MRKMSRGSLEAALLLGDVFLDQIQKVEKSQVKRSKAHPTTVKWRQRDRDGNRVRPLRGKTTIKPKLKRKAPNQAPTSLPIQEEFIYQAETASLIEELEQILNDECDQPEEVSLAITWQKRQSLSHERWQIARESMVRNLLAAEYVQECVCQHCLSTEAIVRCRDCLPRQYLCTICDGDVHQHLPLHNRESMVHGFFKPLCPTTGVKRHSETYEFSEQVRYLPLLLPQKICACSESSCRVISGKPIILINLNGRYNLTLPSLECLSCGKTWAVGLSNLLKSGYWPASIHFETVYEAGLFRSFLDLKLFAPGLSRQAFLGMLDRRTEYNGRSGKICGDTFQKSFLEWTFAQHEVEMLCGVQPFKCPACSPSMHAVSVDGNRKLYRFHNAKGTEKGYFDGEFIMKDGDVSSFVEYVHEKTKHATGKGVCGSSQWTAAKESAKKSTSKIDEEGLEIAVCRHGGLLKALNMFRGEIFAYPLFLQNALSKENVTFFCSDVACKYWPYLKRVVGHCPELRPLLSMHPLLSVMHAKAHEWSCEIKWSGKNQEGAGLTIGEEVEQVNSFLSRAAICTKYMSKAARSDMLTVLASAWNKRKSENLAKYLSQRYIKTAERLKVERESCASLQAELNISDDEIQQWVSDVQQWAAGSSAKDDAGLEGRIRGLYLSIKQRKNNLYHKTDSNKRRHKMRRRMNEDKSTLAAAIKDFNEQSTHQLPSVDELLAADNFQWPWECPDTSNGNLSTKKVVFDRFMLLSRLKEEEQIIVMEVKQHWQSLKEAESSLRDLSLEIQNNNCDSDQESSSGLLCLLKRKLEDLHFLQNNARMLYRQCVLGQASDSILFDNISDEETEAINYSSDDSDEG